MPVFDLARAAWRKSSHSGGYEGGSNCVEVTSTDDVIAVRDSKNPGRGALIFAAGEWRAFLAGIKES
ncbi:MAG TPA: DUF397 domain-containing protein [Streptosporangiaceae bacterium]|jgi:hypothetical protein